MGTKSASGAAGRWSTTRKLLVACLLVGSAAAVALLAQHLASSSRGRDAHKRDETLRLLAKRADLIRQRDRVRERRAELLGATSLWEVRHWAGVLAWRLRALGLGIAASELELGESDRHLRRLRESREGEQVESSPQVIQALDLDPTLRALRGALLTLRARRGSLAGKFGPGHRAVCDLEATMESVEKQIQVRQEAIIDAEFDSILANAESRRSHALDRLDELRAQCSRFEELLGCLKAALAQYDRLDVHEERLSERIAEIDRLLKARSGRAPGRTPSSLCL